jgi:hypothetical protein
MCVAPRMPNIPEPVQRQAAQAPTYREGRTSGAARSGRQGTILTGSQGVMESQPAAKKTLLGQ